MRRYLAVSAAVGLIASACGIASAELLPEYDYSQPELIPPVPATARLLLFAGCAISPPLFGVSHWAPTSWVLEYPAVLRVGWVAGTVALYVSVGAWLQRTRDTQAMVRFGAPLAAWTALVAALWIAAFGRLWA